MRFYVTNRDTDPPMGSRGTWVNLLRDNWDDYGFKTSFHVKLYRDNGETIQLGMVKIPRAGQIEFLLT